MITQGDFSFLSYYVYALLFVHAYDDPEQLRTLILSQSVWGLRRYHTGFDSWQIMNNINSTYWCKSYFSSIHGLYNINIYCNNITFAYWRHVFDCLKLFKCCSYWCLWLFIPVCNDRKRLSMLIFGRSCVWICQLVLSKLKYTDFKVVEY